MAPPGLSLRASRNGHDNGTLACPILDERGPKDLKNQQKTRFIALAHHPGHLRCRHQTLGWPVAIFANAIPELWACDLRVFPTLGVLYLSDTRKAGRQALVKAENDQFEFRDCVEKLGGNSPRK